jgi:hypothetical protein
LAGAAPAGPGFVAYLDAWIVSFRGLFAATADTTEDSDAFFVRYCEMAAQLQALFPLARRSDLHLRWVVDFFKAQLKEMGCADRNAIASLLSRVPRRDALYAELLWFVGTWRSEEEDPKQDITSVCTAVHAAAVHWGGQDEPVRLSARQAIEGRIADCPDSGSPPPQGTRRDPQLEMCALLGGLCILGFAGRALQLIAERDLHRKAPDAFFTVLFFLIEHGAPQLLADGIRFFWGPSPASPHKLILERYLASKGFAVPQTPAADTVLNPNRLWFLSEMGNALDFRPFLAGLCEHAERLERFGVKIRLDGRAT